jgi:hypothetical protein
MNWGCFQAEQGSNAGFRQYSSVLYAAQLLSRAHVCSTRGDTESNKRQDHGANPDVRLRAFAADT